MARIPVAVLLLTLLWSTAASAQRCSGNPSFAGSPFHFAVNLGTDRLAGRYTGEIRARVSGVFAAGFAQQAALIPSVDLPLSSARETTYGLRLALRLSGL